MRNPRVCAMAILVPASLLACGGGAGTASDPGSPGPDLAGVDDAMEPTDTASPADASEYLLDVPEIADALVEDLTEILDTPADEGPSACPGAIGCDCKTNEDCLSGWCITSLAGRRCTTVCPDGESCPAGRACVQVGGSGTDPTFVCVDPNPTLCLPCRTNDDCVPSIPVPGRASTCVEYGPQGRFCGTSCDGDSDCPDGYACVETVADRAAVKRCRPSEGADCACTWLARELGATTVCFVKNDFGLCSGDRACDSACTAATPFPEACNGKDDDCDGAADEADAVECEDYYRDSDGDTYGANGDSLCLCTGAAPYTAFQGGDCDDADPLVHAGRVETCNGKDDDCDGMTDEPDTPGCVVYFRDDDTDGFGTASDSKCLCGPVAPYSAGSAGDCDDGAPGVNPDAPEACNGIDDNCDGLTDEKGASGCTPYFRDGDGDGTGVDGDSECLCGAAAPYSALTGGDCDDKVAEVHPGATEICDFRDNDCDGFVDEEGSAGCVTFRADRDGDGYGPDGDSSCLCHGVSPYTTTKSGDCDDADPESHPDASEVCDGKDNDCDGGTDEELGATTCGVGACQVSVQNCVDGEAQACVPKAASLETCNGLDDDCDGFTDEDQGTTGCGVGACAAIVDNCVDGKPVACQPGNPGVEACGNGIDDDCDGLTDEEGAAGCIAFFEDLDGDGYGTGDAGRCLCGPTGSFTASAGGDCDDGNLLVHPGAVETCNGLDDNCDGSVLFKVDLGMWLHAPPICADVDGEGDQEIVIGDYSGFVKGFKKDGSQVFSLHLSVSDDGKVMRNSDSGTNVKIRGISTAPLPDVHGALHLVIVGYYPPATGGNLGVMTVHALPYTPVRYACLTLGCNNFRNGQMVKYGE